MKTNTNFNKVAQLAKVVALTAMLAVPAVAFADETGTAVPARAVFHTSTVAVHRHANPAAELINPTPAVRFNILDGEPIR